MEQKLPKVCIAAIIKKDNKMLVGKRLGKIENGFFGVPGGSLEFGESPEQGIVREVFEETGATVKKSTFVDFTSSILTNGDHFIFLFFDVEIDGEPRVMEPNKCEAWMWCSEKELPEQLSTPLSNLFKKDAYGF